MSGFSITKISKKDDSTDSKLSSVKETKGSQSNSLNVNKLSQPTQNPISQSFAHLNNSDDDESEDDAPTNLIKAPNELLEEVLFFLNKLKGFALFYVFLFEVFGLYNGQKVERCSKVMSIYFNVRTG